MNVALLTLPVALAAGWAALVLELAWLRSASATLPGALPATALVVPAFLLAWTAGSLVAGRSIDRSAAPARDAGRWLALGAVAAWLVPLLADLLTPAVPPSSAWARLAVGALPALPAAFTLGAVLPLLARVRSAAGCGPARAAGGVAAAVALGGALGAHQSVGLLLAPVAPPLAAALALAAAALLLTAAAGWSAAPVVTAPTGDRAGDAPDGSASDGEPAGMLLGPAALVSGALLIAGQLALLRVAAQSEGASLATSARLLAALHVGMGVGALALARPWRRLPAVSLVAWLLALAAVALALPAGLAGRLPPFAATTLPAGLLGLGAGSIVTAASRARRRRASRFGSWIGDLAGLATLGGVVGGLGHAALLSSGFETPRLVVWLCLTAGAAAVVLALAACAPAARRLAAAASLVPALALVAAAATTPALEWAWRGAPDEVALVSREEGLHGVVSVVALEDGGARLKLDNRFGLGGTAASALARRLGRVAACMAPDADEVLLLGLGLGHTLAGLAATTPGHVTCVERNETVLDLGLVDPQRLHAPGGPPSLHHADARAWVAAHPGSYDLIVGDLFFPWMSGAGDLLSVEHLRTLRRALSDDGVFVQWLPLHQLTWPAFGAAAQAFVEVFPTARVLVATPLADQPLVALVGGLDEGLPEPERLDALLAARPGSAGPNTSGEVYDLVLCDGWRLTQAHRDAAPATLAHPVTEVLTLDRQDDETAIATRNLRLLAALAEPLTTSSLARRPIDPRANRELGLELTRRSSVLRSLLLARHARSARQPLDPTDAGDRPRCEALDVDLDRALLAAWSEMPGHPAVRVALIERARALTDVERWEETAALLHSALTAGQDVPLAGVLGGVYVRLGFLDEARALLRAAREAGPADRTLLLHLAAALLHEGGDDAEALEALNEARERSLGAPLPPLHESARALLSREPGAVERARQVRAALDGQEAWARTLDRLIADS